MLGGLNSSVSTISGLRSRRVALVFGAYVWFCPFFVALTITIRSFGSRCNLFESFVFNDLAGTLTNLLKSLANKIDFILVKLGVDCGEERLYTVCIS